MIDNYEISYIFDFEGRMRNKLIISTFNFIIMI